MDAKDTESPPEENSQSTETTPDETKSPEIAEEPAGETIDEELSSSIADEIVHCFIGEKKPLPGRITSPRYWIGFVRGLAPLILPRSESLAFQLGFWALRLIGAAVIISWFFYGVQNVPHWDWRKLLAGLGLMLLGPLALRSVEFILDNLLLRGHRPGRWRDFWSFRRMMTPRSIQTAFFIGFWLLVVTGAIQVVSGLTDLIGSRDLSKTTARGVFSEMGQGISTATGYLPGFRAPDQPRPGEPHEPDLVALTTRSLTTGATSGSFAPSVTQLGDELYDAILTSVFRRLPDVYPEEITSSKPDESWYAKILRGLLMMIVGPLALRFACESIILFFRINETLTDISRQLELANRLAQSREEEKDAEE